MAGRNHTPAHYRQTLRILDEHNGCISEAARALNIARTTMQHRAHSARAWLAAGAPDDDDRPETVVIHKHETVVRPNYRIVQRGVDQRSVIRVLAIGDAHDSPSLPDKSRFKWMGRHAHETAPDYIVQIGDFATLDSLNTHDPNDTLRGQQKPSFLKDMESFQAALRAFEEGLDGAVGEKRVALGNHEDRALRFINRTPEVADMLDKALYGPLEDHGWSLSPFGAFTFIGDVGFTHAPIGAHGKPYGGMHAENQISRDSIFDVVFGHTHKPLVKRFPKMNRQHLTVVNLGCCLPTGHVEEYARHSLTGWGYGVYDLRIVNGRIEGAAWHSMDDLAERYGD